MRNTTLTQAEIQRATEILRYLQDGLATLWFHPINKASYAVIKSMQCKFWLDGGAVTKVILPYCFKTENSKDGYYQYVLNKAKLYEVTRT